MNPESFQELLWQKSRELYRDMPWRADTQPYYVLVSELMLQQTQVARVPVKFEEFIAMFPTIQTLASAPLSEVLRVWTGLGYNRRAKFLHDAAKQVVSRFNGTLPDSFEKLVSLPGIGPNTARAILAYSVNKPVVFIETNIRTVLFAHFFEQGELVTDAQLREVLESVLDHEHPREFYWAMMDYGAELKRQGRAALDQSRHYKKQSPLKGSVREVRGILLKYLTNGAATEQELQHALDTVDERYPKALQGLQKDGLIQQTNGRFHLTEHSV